jgi:hypothetical protein
MECYDLQCFCCTTLRNVIFVKKSLHKDHINDLYTTICSGILGHRSLEAGPSQQPLDHRKLGNFLPREGLWGWAADIGRAERGLFFFMTRCAIEANWHTHERPMRALSQLGYSRTCAYELVSSGCVCTVEPRIVDEARKMFDFIPPTYLWMVLLELCEVWLNYDRQ